MRVDRLHVNREAEGRLRAVLAREFRHVSAQLGSDQAAADSLGISRQRFKKYLNREMTPKADVLLVAMANWGLRILHEGITFSASAAATRKRPVSPEQLSLEYFDEPQVLRDDNKNVELRVSRKQADTLRFAVEVRLAV